MVDRKNQLFIDHVSIKNNDQLLPFDRSHSGENDYYHLSLYTVYDRVLIFIKNHRD